MVSELKPCPFCGSLNVHVLEEYHFANVFKPVVCRTCGCRTESVRDEQKAIEAWNRRAEE
jgi:Lar family restriction alleviation protein